MTTPEIIHYLESSGWKIAPGVEDGGAYPTYRSLRYTSDAVKIQKDRDSECKP